MPICSSDSPPRTARAPLSLRIVLLTLVALVAPVASQGVDAIAAQELGVAQVALAADVQAAERAFAASMADRDFEAFFSHLSLAAVFFTGDRVLRGRDAVAEGWRGFFEGMTAPFSWQPDQVEVAATLDLAHSSGPVMGPDGAVVGRFNSIWRLEEDGRWRVVFDKGCP